MTNWQIILAIVIVGLSIVMPIYYSHQRKKNSKTLIKRASEEEKIRVYADKINTKTRNKRKWKIKMLKEFGKIPNQQ